MSIPLKSNLITTTALTGSYKAASDPRLKESSTVPFWEDVLNEHMRDRNMSVYSQQPVMDDSTQAVDLAVAYYDGSYQKVFVLVVECKRHKYTTLAEMESQLFAYVQDYFWTEGGGLAKRNEIYGGAAFGTKIRIFKFVNLGKDIQNTPLFGGKGKSSEEFYRDPKTDGAEIHAALLEAKALRDNAGLFRPGGTPFPAAPLTTQLPRGPPFSAGGTPGRAQNAAPATPVKVTLEKSTDPRTIKYMLDGTVYSSRAEEWTARGIIFFNASRNIYASRSST